MALESDYPTLEDSESEPALSEANLEAGGDTAPAGLLPKSIFGARELKPGDRITLTVGRVLDSEVEVTPSEEGESSELEETETPSAPMGPPPADAEIDMMATEQG